MAQEFLVTFGSELQAVSLAPGEESGHFSITIDGKTIFDRKQSGGFPEIKELKQLVRDSVAPGKDLGHADKKSEHPDRLSNPSNSML